MKRMKRFSAMAAALALSVSSAAFAIPASAEDDVVVYVNIIEDHGVHCTFNEAVTLKDIDDDGKLTINDALYLTHEEAFSGGAEAGYGTKQTEWGLSLTKLWGIENGGSYGYYVDGNMAMSLADELKGGEYLDAFCYQDTKYYTDTYSFFEQREAEVDINETSLLTLSLKYIGFDDSWAAVTLPLADATITIDDEETSFKTDKNGEVTIDLTGIDTGWHDISAKSSDLTLVPPLCELILVDSSEPQATDETATVKMNVIGKDNVLDLMNTDISVSDVDKDGRLTVADAIYTAHENYYDGGSAEGLDFSIDGNTGYYISKLWGVEGRAGFAVNDKVDQDIYTEIKDDDYIAVYAYNDQEKFSDTYAYFEEKDVYLSYEDNEVTLHMKKLVYNAETGEYEAVPAANVGVDYIGDRTPELYTDENGEVTITFDDRGTFYALGITDEENLVMPIAHIYAEEDDGSGDGNDILEGEGEEDDNGGETTDGEDTGKDAEVDEETDYNVSEDEESDGDEDEESDDDEDEDEDADDEESDDAKVVNKTGSKGADDGKGNTSGGGANAAGKGSGNESNPKTGNTAEVLALSALLAAGVIAAAKHRDK